MKHLIGPVTASAAVSILGVANQAQAVTTSSSVSGSMGTTAQACFEALMQAVSAGQNCMYDSGPPNASAEGVTAAGLNNVIGPVGLIQYYSTMTYPGAYSTTYWPYYYDSKINQSITGSVTIDDGGNGFGAGDLISFTLTLTDPFGGKVIRHVNNGGGGSTSYFAERWTSMTQVLAPFAANNATANGFGGFDYVIGTEGFPDLLTFGTVPGDYNSYDGYLCNGQTFGNMGCHVSFVSTDSNGNPVTDYDRWTPDNTSGGPGLGSLESNLGAQTMGTVLGFECIDNHPGGTATSAYGCRRSTQSFAPLLGTNGVNQAGAGANATERGAAEDVGWDQLLLKVSTNANGQVVGLAGFDVEEYRLFPTTPGRCGDNTTGTGSYFTVCNSWYSSYFTATATVPAPAAVWLLSSALGALGWLRLKRTPA